MKQTLIAHRGLWNKSIPENTLSSISAAINQNYPIEIDIQLTKDNELIVIHDETLKRTTGLNKRVKDLSLQELNKITILNSKEHIPTLKEVLELVRGKVLIDIEIKHYNKPLKTVKKAYELLRSYEGTYTIKSFNPIIPLLYKKKAPDISCGILAGNYPKRTPKPLKNVLKYLKYLWLYKPDFVCYNFKELDNKVITKLNKHQIPLHLYTIKNKKDLNKALKISNTIVFEQINIK